MERTQKVTTSMLKCFRSCRKRYELEYEECLKPVQTPTALEIGSNYHAAIEMLLKGTPINDVNHFIFNQVNPAIDPVQDEINAYIVWNMVKAFNMGSGWRDWNIQFVEKPFEVSTGYAKRLLGKIDGVITEPNTGDWFLIEHKTTSQWGTDGSTYLHNLLWDDQATNYLYAWSKMLEDGMIEGKAVKGIFYVIVEKPTIRPYKATPLDQRKYTKDGRLYANQHEADESPIEYGNRLHEWYITENRVHTEFVYRNPDEIKQRIDDLNLTIKDIAVCEREGTFYRNPESCKILPCPYRPKCLENSPDTDCLFVRKEARNEELLDNTEIDPHNGKAYSK